jgi:hypothetical protein
MAIGRPVPSWKVAPIVIYEDDERVVLASHLSGLDLAATATRNWESPRDRVPELTLVGVTEGREWLDEHLEQHLELDVASNQGAKTKWFHLQVGFVVDPTMGAGERYRFVVEAVKERPPPHWATSGS